MARFNEDELMKARTIWFEFEVDVHFVTCRS